MRFDYHIISYLTDFPTFRDTEDGPGDNGSGTEAPAVPDNLSLNSFLGRFTSEDNAAFEQLQEEARERHREKLRSLGRDEGAHNAKVDLALALPSATVQMAAIAAASISDEKGGPSEADKLITWRYATRNAVMFDPEGAPLTTEESARLKLSQPVIRHENTRFRARPFSVLPRQTPVAGGGGPTTNKQSQALLSGKIGVDGKEAGSGAGGTTPAVNGFKYVASTPTLAPGSGIPESPLMTWGEYNFFLHSFFPCTFKTPDRSIVRDRCRFMPAAAVAVAALFFPLSTSQSPQCTPQSPPIDLLIQRQLFASFEIAHQLHHHQQQPISSTYLIEDIFPLLPFFFFRRD